MRRITAIVLAFVLVVTAGPAAADSALDAARRRANQAAQELAQAHNRLAELEGEITDLERRITAATARLEGLESLVKELAVASYVNGASQSHVIFEHDLNQSARAAALASIVAGASTDAVDEYKAVREDLAIARAQLDARQGEARRALEVVQQRSRAAQAELQRQVQLDRQRQEREAARRRAASARQSARSTAPARVIATGSWICPVQGPRAFTNDWGAPRSGGRRHMGNDILAPRGTPVVAPVSGTVTHRSVRLGGLSFYLRGDDGITYFGTHMSRYGAGGRVSAGTVIGYVGDTGNARGTPHLHFEMHPGGGAAINPYPTLRQHC